jgi:hypothetical protein
MHQTFPTLFWITIFKCEKYNSGYTFVIHCLFGGLNHQHFINK